MLSKTMLEDRDVLLGLSVLYFRLSRYLTELFYLFVFGLFNDVLINSNL
jgi:hypothetical protein